MELVSLYLKQKMSYDNNVNVMQCEIIPKNYTVDSTQNRDYWRTLVNAALNLQVP